ncbi:MAG: hypothetical protein F6K58_07555 [Symploca sp. SIO2E9]|nr:hypothetical protein [Symploca sp. SIO2E9]
MGGVFRAGGGVEEEKKMEEKEKATILESQEAKELRKRSPERGKEKRGESGEPDKRRKME